MFFLRPLVLNYTVYNYVDLVFYGTCCIFFLYFGVCMAATLARFGLNRIFRLNKYI